MNNISGKIIPPLQDGTIVNKWNTVVKELKAKASITEIEETIAYKFKGDFYRLLKSIGDLQIELWYPSLLINGLTSPYDYDGKTTMIYEIDVKQALMYHRIFTKDME